MYLIAFVYILIKNIRDTYDINDIGTDALKHLQFVTLEMCISEKILFLWRKISEHFESIAIFLLVLFLYLSLYSVYPWIFLDFSGKYWEYLYNHIVNLNLYMTYHFISQ